jgi:hypothetical protein
MSVLNNTFPAKLTLPLSGRQETGGGEAESWWRPVHSKGLFGVSHNNRQTRQTLAQSNAYVTSICTPVHNLSSKAEMIGSLRCGRGGSTIRVKQVSF